MKRKKFGWVITMLVTCLPGCGQSTGFAPSKSTPSNAAENQQGLEAGNENLSQEADATQENLQSQPPGPPEIDSQSEGSEVPVPITEAPITQVEKSLYPRNWRLNLSDQKRQVIQEKSLTLAGKITQSMQLEFVAEVDLLIAIDTSGSMKNDVDLLADELNLFLHNLPAGLDLRVNLASRHLAQNHLLGGSCLKMNKGAVAEDSIQIEEFVHNIQCRTVTRTTGSPPVRCVSDTGIKEQPFKFSVLALQNSLAAQDCFRPQSKKYLFVLSDEDERIDASPEGSNSIDDARALEFINGLEPYSPKVYSMVIQGQPNSKLNPTQIVKITEALGGTLLDLRGNFSGELAKLTDDIIRASAYPLDSSGNIFLDSLVVFENTEGGQQPLVKGIDYQVVSQDGVPALVIEQTTINPQLDLGIEFFPSYNMQVQPDLSGISAAGYQLEVVNEQGNTCLAREPDPNGLVALATPDFYPCLTEAKASHNLTLRWKIDSLSPAPSELLTNLDPGVLESTRVFEKVLMDDSIETISEEQFLALGDLYGFPGLKALQIRYLTDTDASLVVPGSVDPNSIQVTRVATGGILVLNEDYTIQNNPDSEDSSLVKISSPSVDDRFLIEYLQLQE